MAGLSKTTFGAEVFTREPLIHGKFEACVISAPGKGVVTGVFTFPAQRERTHWRELDFELLGSHPGQVQTNIIIQTGEKRESRNEQWHEVLGHALRDHVYAIEWTPHGVMWFVDGACVRRLPPEHPHAKAFFNEPQTFRLNIWATSSKTEAWAGVLDTRLLPAETLVKWVKAFKFDTVTNSHSQIWYDDFNNFDATRWEKATWRVDRSSTVNVAANALPSDVGLVLKLTATDKAS
jgi:beta-glucanase (GH16 family)